MNLAGTRVGLLVAPLTAAWYGVVVSYDATSYTLTVTTTGGALAAAQVGYLLVFGAATVRVRVVTPGSGTLKLSETPLVFAAGDGVALYPVRLPFPRYQRLLAAGTIYKDTDIAYPGAAAASPPCPVVSCRLSGTANEYSEAALVAVGESVDFTAVASYATYPGATPLTHTWDAGTDGVITGSGATVTAAWSTAGFRYLTYTATDANGITAQRYIPVWVGLGAEAVDVLRLSATWRDGDGWSVRGDTLTAVSYLANSPAAVVDLDSYAVLFFGFLIVDGVRDSFAVTEYGFTLASGMAAYARQLHSYPIMVVNTDGTPGDWATVKTLTVGRALWQLLYWHSTLPEVVNCVLGDVTVRQIAGQEFRGAEIAGQVRALADAAKQAVRGYRSGGFALTPDPLYLAEADWNALSAADLSDASALFDGVEETLPEPRISEARIGGVYRNPGGDYAPIITLAPTHPLDRGAPTEVGGLAPVSTAEIVQWAARYVAIETNAAHWSARPVAFVDPAEFKTADIAAPVLGGVVRIALEETSLEFNGDRLAMTQKIGGRARGTDVAVSIVPPPPPVVYPTPTYPPLEPPVAIIPDELGRFLLRAGMAGADTVVYLCENADAAAPTWTDITGDLVQTKPPYGVAVCLASDGATLAALVALVDGAVYLCADALAAAPTWSALSAPAGTAFVALRTTVQAAPGDNSRAVLINVYDGLECYAWVVDATGAQVSLTLVGAQALDATRHCGWWDTASAFCAGHDTVAGVDLVGHNVSTGVDYDPGDVETVEGTNDISITWDIKPTVNDGLYKLATVSPAAWLSVANNAVAPVTIEATFIISAYSNAQYSTLDGPWVTGSGVTIASKTLTIAASDNGGMTFSLPPDLKLRFRIRGYTTAFARCALRIRINRSGVTNAAGVLLSFADLGNETDTPEAYHLQVPVGYTGDLADLLETTCGSGVCDAGSCCAEGADGVLYCPGWALNPVERLDGYAWLHTGADGALETSPDFAGGPCGTPVASPVVYNLYDGATGRGTAGAAALVDVDAGLLYITDDGFQTQVSVALPAAIGAAARGCCVLGSEVFVAGATGVQAYSLTGSGWRDVTGDLPELQANADGMLVITGI